MRRLIVLSLLLAAAGAAESAPAAAADPDPKIDVRAWVALLEADDIAGYIAVALPLAEIAANHRAMGEQAYVDAIRLGRKRRLETCRAMLACEPELGDGEAFGAPGSRLATFRFAAPIGSFTGQVLVLKDGHWREFTPLLVDQPSP
jgi:hypothetical protein